MARGLKFRIKELEEVYYIFSENKGADQLRGYHEVDLRLCFRICKKPIFLRRCSYIVLIVFRCCGIELQCFDLVSADHINVICNNKNRQKQFVLASFQQILFNRLASTHVKFM